MILRIEQDHNRFKQIIRGRIKKDLKKYISSGELIGRRGKDYISIPLPQIRIPQFIYGPKQTGGVGQGEGAIGTVLGAGEVEGGKQEAGNQPGEHLLEVDISLDELAEMLGEELELPAIRPKGRKNILSNRDRYTGISRYGPETLRHFKRTYKETLKRSISTGTYRPDHPILIPIRADKRFRSWKTAAMPQANAVIIYMMDVAEAREVDRETFYHTRESGGTVISAAYKLCSKIVDLEYPAEEWNTYCLHFSDGDNWSQGDTEECVNILKGQLLPRVNLFCYGQVESPYGTGQFLVDLKEAYGDDERVAVSKIENKDGIYQSIKDFLGRGR